MRLELKSERRQTNSSTGFIWEMQCLDLVSNIIVVKRTNDKRRICIDFKKTKGMRLKKSYPHTNTILWYSIVRSSNLNFLVASSDYYQIKMHPRYTEKTSFIIWTEELSVIKSCHFVWKMQEDPIKYWWKKYTKLGRKMPRIICE